MAEGSSPYRTAGRSRGPELSVRALLVARQPLWFAVALAVGGFALVRELSRPDASRAMVALSLVITILAIAALFLVTHRTRIRVDRAAGMLVVDRFVPFPPRRVAVEMAQIACVRASAETGRGRVVAELRSGESVLLFLAHEARIPLVVAELEALREASTRDDAA